MTAIPLSRCLDELWPDGRTRPSPSAVPVALVQPVAPPESLFEEAHERGRQEAFAVARAEYERALGEQRRLFDERIAAEREKWVATQSEVITRRIEGSFQALEAAVSGLVAQVLKPFVADALKISILEDLSSVLKELIAKGRASHLRIAGPEDLLEALKERLADHSGVEYVLSATGELEIEADRTLVETRVSEWRRQLQELSA